MSNIDARMSELKEIKKLEEDNKPFQQSLPLIFENSRVIPNAFIRSALFGMVKKGARKFIDEEVLAMNPYKMRYKGDLLDQNDLEVWDTVIYLAKQLNADDRIETSIYRILKEIGLQTNSGNNTKAIVARLTRLQGGQLTYSGKTPENKKILYVGSLIDDFTYSEDGKLIIRFNKTLRNLFIENDYTFIDCNTRLVLGDSQMTKWLFHLYSSHKTPIPLTLEFLKQLARSTMVLSDFRKQIRKSITELSTIGWKCYIDSEDRLIVNKKQSFNKEII
jgi:hypothetical protein